MTTFPIPLRFIVFEGVDGAGKSTLVSSLAQWLSKQGKSVVTTREPGGTPIGERLRELVLHATMHPETELMLMCAARREHLLTVIEPALAAGAWVLSDRFADASYAYQVAGRGVAAERFAVLDAWTREGVVPGMTFVLDLAPEVALARRQHRAEASDRFEQESAAFFSRVRAAYLQCAASDPQRYRVLDATQAPERLRSQAIAALKERFAELAER